MKTASKPPPETSGKRPGQGRGYWVPRPNDDFNWDWVSTEPEANQE